MECTPLRRTLHARDHVTSAIFQIIITMSFSKIDFMNSLAVTPGTMGALVAASVLAAQQQQQHQAVQQSSSQNNIIGGTGGLVNSNAVSTGGATNTSSMLGVQGVPGMTGIGKR